MKFVQKGPPVVVRPQEEKQRRGKRKGELPLQKRPMNRNVEPMGNVSERNIHE